MASTVFSRLFVAPRARRWLLGVTVGGAALLSGCVLAPISDTYGTTEVYTTYGHPPPPRVEYRYAAPSVQHIWIGGDWFWNDHRYHWRPGHWAAPGFRASPAARPPHMRPPPAEHHPHVRQSQGRAPHLKPDDRPRPPQMRPEMRPDGPPRGERPQRRNDEEERRR